jgi:uncharacterized membrane protein (UPF0127 family)
MATMAFAAAISAAAASALPVIVVHAPAADLRLEVATTPAQQEQGLMYRTSLAPHTGMLFVFGSDGPVAFWMKNTLVPLDMLFVAADGRVRTVSRNVAPAPPSMPDDQIPRENGTAKYVIELPAGEASRDGISPGVTLAIPKTTSELP